jgi:hypothetical protein
MNNIYVVRGTEQVGPFTENDIRAQLASGAITGDSLVWWDGLPEWTALSRSPLASLLASPGTAPAVVAGAVPAPALAVGVVAPGTAKTSTLALVSLITGIVGIPTFFCYGLGLALGIVAVVTGHISRGQLAKNPAEGGKGMALAGLICGYTSIVLTLVAIVGIAVLIALGNQVKTVFSTISSQLQSAEMTNSAPANQ